MITERANLILEVTSEHGSLLIWADFSAGARTGATHLKVYQRFIPVGKPGLRPMSTTVLAKAKEWIQDCDDACNAGEAQVKFIDDLKINLIRSL